MNFGRSQIGHLGRLWKPHHYRRSPRLCHWREGYCAKCLIARWEAHCAPESPTALFWISWCHSWELAFGGNSRPMSWKMLSLRSPWRWSVTQDNARSWSVRPFAHTIAWMRWQRRRIKASQPLNSTLSRWDFKSSRWGHICPGNSISYLFFHNSRATYMDLVFPCSSKIQLGIRVLYLRGIRKCWE